MAVRTAPKIVFAGLFAALLTLACPAQAGTVYFVVAERPGVEEHHDSFVLPLTQEADIAHARDLIARGPDAAGSAIAFASVVAGADGINRNVVADGEPLWSWHVKDFEGFGDFGIELVDGWPTYLESDVQGWIANTKRDDPNVGHIGFWNYTVVAELPDGSPVTIPLPTGVATGAIGLFAVVVARQRPWVALLKMR